MCPPTLKWEHKSHIRLHRLKALRRGKDGRFLQMLRNVETVVRVHLSLDHLRQSNRVRVENEGIARLHPLGAPEVLQFRLLASFVLDHSTSQFPYLNLLRKERVRSHILHNLKLVRERTLCKGTTVNHRSRGAEHVPQCGNSS